MALVALPRPEASQDTQPCSEQSERDWFALAVKPRHEKSVSLLLDYKGYATCLPLYKKRHRHGRREFQFQLPLFPGYVFCRLDLYQRLPVLTTPGVTRILGYGKTPTPLETSEIVALQSALKNQLHMQPHPFLREGDRVRITEGSLAGIEGIVTRPKNPTRIVLSVTLLERSVLVELDSECLEALGSFSSPCSR